VPEISETATPPMPARPEPMKKVIRSVARVEMPIVSARSRFCTVARMRRPKEVYFSRAARAPSEASASTIVKIWR